MFTIALDVHAHLIPVEPEKLKQFHGIAFDDGTGKLTIDGHAVGMKQLFQPDMLLAWMEREGVQQAWISAPPPTYRPQLQGEAAYAWSRYLNEGLQSIAAQSDKLTALTHLPIQAPEIAAQIVVECVGQGHRLFSMPTNTGDGRALSDHEFEPLWNVLNEARAFIFAHPGECADGRLASFYLTNLLGNPHESAVAISHLVLGGVLERYPDILLCFAHGGGTFPMIAGRVQRGFASGRPGVDTSREAPAHMARRLFVDCICHNETALMLAERTFGSDNIVFGSDWPFPMGIVGPANEFAHYDAARRYRCFEENPRKLIARLLEK